MRLIKFLSMTLFGVGLLAMGIYSIYLYQNSMLYSREPLPARLSLENEVVQFAADSSGFVRIKAFSERGAMIGQGYASAWKSMWEMDLLRRAALGRLSEVFGQSTAPIDKFFRAFQLDSLSKKLYRESDPSGREWLDWYAEGVRLYIEQHRPGLAPEFRYLNSDPIPWEPAHSLLIYRFLCLNAELSWKQRLLFDRIEKADQAVLPNSDAQQIILNLLNGFIAFNRWWGKPEQFGQAYAVNRIEPGRGIRFSFRNPVFQTGSLGTWQPVHLSCRNFELAGAALPGTPGVFAGQNTHIAWGIMPLDSRGGELTPVKMHLEKFTADNRRISGGFRLAKEHLLIGNRVIPFLTRKTRYGPLLVKETAEPHPVAGVIMEWNSQRSSDEFRVLRDLARATSTDHLTQTFSRFKAPSSQLVFCDLRRRVGSIFPAPGSGEAEQGELRSESTIHAGVDTSVLFTGLGGFRIVESKAEKEWVSRLFRPVNQASFPGGVSSLPDFGVAGELDRMIGEMIGSWLPVVIKSQANSPADSSNQNLPVLLRENTDVPELEEVRHSFLITWRWFALREYLALHLSGKEHHTFMVQPDLYWSAYQRLSVFRGRGGGEKMFRVPDSLAVNSYQSAIRYWEAHLGEHPYNWTLSALETKLRGTESSSLIDMIAVKQSRFLIEKNLPENQATGEEMKIFLEALFNEFARRNFIRIPRVMPIKLRMQVGVFDNFRNIYLPREKKQPGN